MTIFLSDIWHVTVPSEISFTFFFYQLTWKVLKFYLHVNHKTFFWFQLLEEPRLVLGVTDDLDVSRMAVIKQDQSDEFAEGFGWQMCDVLFVKFL